MANLIPQTPAQGLLPATLGTVTLSEVDLGPVTSVMPFKGQERAVSAALKDALGIGLPAPNRMVSKGDARALWIGRGQALVLGTCSELPGAACVDHSAAWVCVALTGADVEPVLARLVPLDLRRAIFKTGHTARTLVGHMTCSVTRTGATTFEIMAMRSMAGTLVEDLERAARLVAAR